MRYNFRLRAHVHVDWLQTVALPGSNWPNGQCSSPSIATAFACWLKTTNITVLRNTNVLSANKLGVVLGFGQLTVWLLVYEQTPAIRLEALDVTYKH